MRVLKGAGERARREHNLQCRREHCITSRVRWQINQESQSAFVTCLATQQRFSTLPSSLSTPEKPAELYVSLVKTGPALGGENTGARTW